MIVLLGHGDSGPRHRSSVTKNGTYRLAEELVEAFHSSAAGLNLRATQVPVLFAHRTHFSEETDATARVGAAACWHAEWCAGARRRSEPAAGAKAAD